MRRNEKFLTAMAAAFMTTAAVSFSSMAAVDTDFHRFVVGTIINGVPVSGMTTADAEAYIEGYFNGGYTLEIEDTEGVREAITDTSIGYTVDVTGDLEAILKEENDGGRVSGPGVEHRYTVDAELKYDEAALRALLENMAFVKNASPTSDAYITPYEEGKAFSIVPEVQGTEIDMDKLMAAVKDALNSQTRLLKVENLDCYKTIQVTADNADLNQMCANLNRYKDINITYVFGDQQEILPGLEAVKWIDGVSGSTVQVNQQKVAEYVKYLADKYDTYGKPHTFTSTSGRQVSVNGDYGWQINQAEEAVALTRMVQNGTNQTREPAYSRTAASRTGNDFGTTYVEVDMGLQHIYMYENGTLIAEAPIVTGNVAKGWTTPEGLYTLYYKERDRVLRGPKRADGTYSYESPVSYWMPFNGGIGLHDANWRGKFGGEIYKNNGSHGCINIPPKTAAVIFEHAYKGIPILCFY
ncbi:MAG: peptidoglycan binding domain-containing protein [Lachnospiraceae bacterium]|nr:peptidoglycan binding domain-containing protein [Lachnospiraceae bacterium]